MNINQIEITELTHHPLNRSVEGLDDSHIEDIANSMMSSGFHPTKAITVREVADGYEIIEGHHRFEAAKIAGIESIPAYVEDLSDDDALIKLINGNRQRGNNPFDIGLAALHLVKAGKGATYSDYAERLGVSKQHLGRFVGAARVLKKLSPCGDRYVSSPHGDKINGLDRHFYEISKTPPEFWPSLVDALIKEELSVNLIKARTNKVRDLIAAKPDWYQIRETAHSDICGKSRYAENLKNGLSRAVEILETLSLKTLYRHVDSKETIVQEGREYRVHKPEPYEFDSRSEFMSLVCSSQGMISDINEAEAAVLREIAENSSGAHKLLAVLSEEEQRLADEESERDALQARREQLTPTMINSDCESALKTIQDSTVDLVVIDPPYNMDKADWDSFGSGEDFADWCEIWLRDVERVLKPSGALYMFGINRMLSHVQHRLDALGMAYKDWITWDTIQGAGGGLWVNRTESILYYSKTDAPYEDKDSIKLQRHEENVREYKGKIYEFKNPSNIWRFPCVDEQHPDRTFHPTQKPVELIERIVKASCPEGGLVLDCFMGSGTTGVACMKTNRRCVGVETSGEYIELAASRYESVEID